jgi:hypothetical protein
MFDFRFNIHSYFPESGPGKHFQASGMRVTDFSHEITPRNMILREKCQNFSIFASIHTTISLKSRKLFKVRKCAQSIPCMKLALIGSFLKKILSRKIAQILVFLYTLYLLNMCRDFFSYSLTLDFAVFTLSFIRILYIMFSCQMPGREFPPPF